MDKSDRSFLEDLLPCAPELTGEYQKAKVEQPTASRESGF